MNHILGWGGARTGEAPAPPEPAPFDASARGEWAWEQPRRLRSFWELRAGDAVIGTLAGRGLLSESAEMRIAGACWTLRPQFPAGMLVCAGDAAEPLVRYRAGWLGGGRIERTGQPTLLWRREDFWRSCWGILTADQMPLVHLRPRRALLRRQATLEIEDAARRLDDLPTLLALGWMLALRAHRSHGGGH